MDYMLLQDLCSTGKNYKKPSYSFEKVILFKTFYFFAGQQIWLLAQGSISILKIVVKRKQLIGR